MTDREHDDADAIELADQLRTLAGATRQAFNAGDDIHGSPRRAVR